MRRLLLVGGLLTAFVGAVVFGPPASAQRGDELQQMRQAFTERNDAVLAEPYRGITPATTERDLFPIRATGVEQECPWVPHPTELEYAFVGSRA